MRMLLSGPGRALFAPLMIAVSLIVACSPKPSSTSPTTTAATIVDLATPGKNVYANRCAGCHGNEGPGGSGPPLVGARATLDRYENAGALYDFISRSMPFNAPSSLLRTEYEQVLGYLVLNNGFAEESTPFKSGDLDGLPLNATQ